MIKAGEIDDIRPDSGSWVILDIGFSSKLKSCGLLIDHEEPKVLKFNDAVREICTHISVQKSNVNLLIEAPLSVAFDANGNPKGRFIEKQDLNPSFSGQPLTSWQPHKYINQLDFLKQKKRRMKSGGIILSRKNMN